MDENINNNWLPLNDVTIYTVAPIDMRKYKELIVKQINENLNKPKPMYICIPRGMCK